jgi:hypothetical protein
MDHFDMFSVLQDQLFHLIATHPTIQDRLNFACYDWVVFNSNFSSISAISWSRFIMNMIFIGCKKNVQGTSLFQIKNNMEKWTVFKLYHGENKLHSMKWWYPLYHLVSLHYTIWYSSVSFLYMHWIYHYSILEVFLVSSWRVWGSSVICVQTHVNILQKKIAFFCHIYKKKMTIHMRELCLKEKVMNTRTKDSKIFHMLINRQRQSILVVYKICILTMK